MKNLLAVLVLTVLAVVMFSSAIFVGGCQQSSDVNGRVAATPTTAPSDDASQNDNGSEWYGEAGSDK
jgi:hypothetical protein